MLTRLQAIYPNRVILLHDVNEIPSNKYMVYLLAYNNNPIVLGHGKRNRSKVIFDNVGIITPSHLKAMFVRLYVLFGEGQFSRFIIIADDKQEAHEIEKNLHQQIGGNHRIIPNEIRKKLFDGIAPYSVEYLVLEIALRSSFDGLSDIRKWRKDGILNDDVWYAISNKLQLN